VPGDVCAVISKGGRASLERLEGGVRLYKIVRVVVLSSSLELPELSMPVKLAYDGAWKDKASNPTKLCGLTREDRVYFIERRVAA